MRITERLAVPHGWIAAVLRARYAWAIVGALNIALGVATALKPGQSQDLGLVSAWLRLWAMDGVSPYLNPDLTTDYPPYAIALLSPILLVAPTILPMLWAALSAVLSVLVAWLGVKAMHVERHARWTVPLGAFLAWQAVRVGLGNAQFSLLVVACGLGAVCAARAGSRWSGVLLGLAMVKPHVGVAFMAWAVLERRLWSVVVALGVLALGTLLFAVRVHQSLFVVVAAYITALQRLYGGAGFTRGDVEIRPLLHDIVRVGWIAETVNVALVILAFAVIMRSLATVSEEGRTRTALPLACLWALMSFFHNIYDLVLMWPVWIALWQRQGPGPARWRSSYVLALLQGALVIGIPGLWWRPAPGTPGAVDAQGSVLGLMAVNFDRLLVCGLLVYSLRTSARPSGEPAPVP